MHTLLPPCSTSGYQRLQKAWRLCTEMHGRGRWLQNCLQEKELETPYLLRGAGRGCRILHVHRVSGTVWWRRLPETPGSPESGLATGTLSEGVSGKAVVESTASHPQGQYLQKLEK